MAYLSQKQEIEAWNVLFRDSKYNGIMCISVREMMMMMIRGIARIMLILGLNYYYYYFYFLIPREV